MNLFLTVKKNFLLLFVLFILSVVISGGLSWIYIKQISVKSSSAIFLVNNDNFEGNLNLSSFSLGFGAGNTSKNEKILHALMESPAFHKVVLFEAEVYEYIKKDYENLDSMSNVQISAVFRNTFNVDKDDEHGYFLFKAKSQEIERAAILANSVLSKIAIEISDIKQRESERFLSQLNKQISVSENVSVSSKLYDFYEEKFYKKLLSSLGDTSVLEIISQAVPFERRAWPALRTVFPILFFTIYIGLYVMYRAWMYRIK